MFSLLQSALLECTCGGAAIVARGFGESPGEQFQRERGKKGGGGIKQERA